MYTALKHEFKDSNIEEVRKTLSAIEMDISFDVIEISLNKQDVIALAKAFNLKEYKEDD